VRAGILLNPPTGFYSQGFAHESVLIAEGFYPTLTFTEWLKTKLAADQKAILVTTSSFAYLLTNIPIVLEDMEIITKYFETKIKFCNE